MSIWQLRRGVKEQQLIDLIQGKTKYLECTFTQSFKNEQYIKDRIDIMESNTDRKFNIIQEDNNYYIEGYESGNYEVSGYINIVDVPPIYFYGDVDLIFKKERLIERTMYTVGDSYDVYIAQERKIQKHPLKDLSLNLTFQEMQHIVQFGVNKLTYLELQIYGGITIDDIEQVIVDVENPQLFQILNEYKMPYKKVSRVGKSIYISPQQYLTYLLQDTKTVNELVQSGNWTLAEINYYIDTGKFLPRKNDCDVQKTKNNHTIGEVYSCMQKAIRRNDVGLAVYCANELDTKPLSKRLIQNTLEDSLNYNLAVDIFDNRNSREQLLKFVQICCKLPKTHFPAALNKLYKESLLDDETTEELTETIENLSKKEKQLSRWIGDKTFKQIACVKMNQKNKKYDLDDAIQIKSPKQPVKFPKWVYDKHVHGGTPGYKFFFDNLVLEPEQKIEKWQQEVFDEAKKMWIIGSIPIDGEQMRLSAQLRTAKFKPSVQFVKVDDKWKYVIKGPLESEFIEKQIYSEKMKKKLGLNSTYLRTIGKYMIFKNIIPIDEDDTVTASSKLEHEVELYNGNRYILDKEFCQTLDKKIVLDVLKVLVFRKMIGTNDTTYSNILVIDNQVYSIDDPAYDQSTPYIFKMKYSKFKYTDKMEKFIDFCKEKCESKSQKKRLDDIEWI